MLPSAAGFVDPLFSTGFVLTLLGIERLATAFKSAVGPRRPSEPQLSARLWSAAVRRRFSTDYQAATFRELDATARLISSVYSTFHDFPKFTDVSRFYFAAAIWSETLRRLGKAPPSFLFSAENSPPPLDQIDLAGLTDPTRRNWFPAQSSDLHANAHKIPATPTEIDAMLKRCGF